MNPLITNIWRYEYAAPLGTFDRPPERASEYRRDSLFIAMMDPVCPLCQQLPNLRIAFEDE